MRWVVKKYIITHITHLTNLNKYLNWGFGPFLLYIGYFPIFHI